MLLTCGGPSAKLEICSKFVSKIKKARQSICFKDTAIPAQKNCEAYVSSSLSKYDVPDAVSASRMNNHQPTSMKPKR